MARESTTIVIIGATGDLTRRKLIRFPSKTLRQRQSGMVRFNQRRCEVLTDSPMPTTLSQRAPESFRKPDRCRSVLRWRPPLDQ